MTKIKIIEDLALKSQYKFICTMYILIIFRGNLISFGQPFKLRVIIHILKVKENFRKNCSKCSERLSAFVLKPNSS